MIFLVKIIIRERCLNRLKVQACRDCSHSFKSIIPGDACAGKVDLCTMAYHTRSKGTPLSPPSLKHKGKRKIVDENNIKRVETVEKEYLSNELTLKLEQKMAKLEREVIGMRNWAKLPSMGNHATANQTILPNHPIPNPTNQLQNPSNSIYVPQSNYLYAP